MELLSKVWQENPQEIKSKGLILMIQVDISCHTSGQDINEYLRLWQSKYTKRKIINVDTTPVEPAGWFLTIVYEMEVRM